MIWGICFQGFIIIYLFRFYILQQSTPWFHSYRHVVLSCEQQLMALVNVHNCLAILTVADEVAAKALKKFAIDIVMDRLVLALILFYYFVRIHQLGTCLHAQFCPTSS